MLTFFYIIYTASALWAFISILLYGDRPARSIAWIFIVILIPILGVLFYIIFGINRKRFKFFTLNFNAKRKLYALNHNSDSIEEFKHKFDSTKYSKIGKLMRKSSGFPAIDGNTVEVIKNPNEVFDKILQEIDKAEKFIHLQYYILEEGEILDKFCSLLQKKAQEGVEVRILYDALGSNGWSNRTIKKLKKSGVHIFPILPIKLTTILSTLNYRNHRKIVIIDGVIGFTGGVNVSDKYVKEVSPLGIWDDLHIKLEGGVVDHLHRIFIKDYYFASNDTLLAADDDYVPKQKKAGEMLVQVVAGGPDMQYLSILHQYAMMIHCAEESIYIENPYFIPDKVLLEAIKMAVLRNVEVKIMVPKNIDSKVAKYSMFSRFEDLLKAGVHIYLLKDTFSHSKLIIIDGELVSIGSGNFDYRSFEHNYEANTLIFDEKIAKDLKKDFEKNIEKCKTLNYEAFEKRSYKEKLLEGMARIFSPLL